MAAEALGGPAAPAYSPRSRRRTSSQPISRVETGFTIGLAVLLFTATLTFGAARLETALAYTGLFGLYAVSLLSWTWARRGLAGVRDLRPLAAMSGLLLLALCWPLTPFVPGGPHPVWSYVPGAGAGVIDRSAVLVELLKLAGLACVFLCAATLAASERRARLLFQTLLTLAALYAAWALIAHFTEPRYVLGVGKRFHMTRLTGSFLSANSAGSLFGVCLTMFLAGLIERLRGGPRPLEQTIRRLAPYAIGLILTGSALLMTASRGALAATAVAIVILLLSEAFQGRWRWRTGGALVGLALAVAALPFLFRVGQMAVDRSENLAVDTASRQEIFAAHWAAFTAAPWTGYGLGTFSTLNQLIVTPANYDALKLLQALHNVYLHWLVEAGLAGSAAMFALIGYVLFLVSRAALRGAPGDMMLKGAVAASLVLLIHGLSDYALQVPSIQATWACLLGLGFGLARAKSRRR